MTTATFTESIGSFYYRTTKFIYVISGGNREAQIAFANKKKFPKRYTRKQRKLLREKFAKNWEINDTGFDTKTIERSDWDQYYSEQTDKMTKLISREIANEIMRNVLDNPINLFEYDKEN